MSSNITHLSAIRSATGIVFRLKPFESITKVVVTQNSVTFLLEAYTVKDTRGAETLTARFTKLYQLVRNTDKSWELSEPVIIPDTTFVPRVHNKYMPNPTPEAHTQKLKRERMAYRVEAGRFPSDSYTRKLQG